MFSNSGINKVFLLGQVTDDPFIQKQESVQNYLCFTLVTSENVKKGTDNITHKEYHKIKISHHLAQQDVWSIEPGQTLYIEGRVQTTTYVDDQRIKRYDLEVIAVKAELIA